jgi:hypothetical protein
VSVQALVAVLHIGYRVPMKMVKRMLRELFGLRISAGEVVALLDGVKLAGEGRRQQLLEQDADRPQVGAWVEALKARYEEAQAFASAGAQLPADSRGRLRQRRRCEQLAARLARPYAKYPDAPQRVQEKPLLASCQELLLSPSPA